ncbi:Integral membrane protein TerC [Chondromyces apiculatus DSM 436]|uniref:Integral membrane protein TerC n=1 Tax=Chondromyces apiculatus DSM 436 TaxID=1192034 RepID=A0A017SSZ2_9BACT|nr:Integral membrane protein TerC [Chondromyces apiculatus DSM 436]
MLALLGVDLFTHRGGHSQSRRAAIVWSIIWVTLGFSFSGFVWATMGGKHAQEYLASWLIEKSLSLDNVFVFLVVFRTLTIPKKFQHEVLFLGIFGALVFRAIFIFVGAAALERWHWVAYIFGAILLFTAYRVLREDPDDDKENPTVAWLSKRMPVTPTVEGPEFFVKKEGRRLATPLLVALVGLELTDIVFAVDSVPAAFSVTNNTFILYSSNAFAILGLRALYLVIAEAVGELKYLHYGLAGVLAFAGLKILLAKWLHIPPLLSVGIIAVFIGTAVWASLRHKRAEAALHPGEPGTSPGES